MVTYVVNYTNTDRVNSVGSPEDSITVDSESIDQSISIALFGRKKLAYGELMNENILHLLENFACPEDALYVGTPDLTKALDNTLETPVEGQMWYNSTKDWLCMWTNGAWVPISQLGEVACNAGTIYGDGTIALPLPIGSSGYEFKIEECHWMVGPWRRDDTAIQLECSTDSNAFVTMKYRTAGMPVNTWIPDYANYMIIGIKYSDLPLSQMYNPPPGYQTGPDPSPTVPVVTPDVTPTVTPTPSPLPAFGEDLRLFVAPSECDPGGPGPGGVLTYIPDTCGNVNKSAFDKSLYVSIQGIEGGVAPYTVDFNITTDTGINESFVELVATNSEYPSPEYEISGNVESVIDATYYGGTGLSTDSTRTSLSPGEIPYARLRYNIERFYNKYNWQARMRLTGSVTITDDVGTTRTFYIPSSEDGCPLGGSNITSAPAESLYWGYITWKHYGIGGNNGCDNCVNCVR